MSAIRSMKAKRRWLATVAATLLIGSTGCQTWFGGMTLPSGRYLEHYPQYFAPDPQHPLPRELANMEDPEGAARRAGGFGAGIAPVAPGAPIGPVVPGAPLLPAGPVPGAPPGVKQ